MTTMMPGARPKIDRAELEGRLELRSVDKQKYPITIVGLRGYYRDTMGKPMQNDRGIYDDAICLLTLDVFWACNGNTDPSKGRPGMAVLQPDFYPCYRFDLHHGRVKTYEAICQRSGPVTILRDGDPTPKTGMFGINIHRGGFWSTGSEGCQTIPPEQWSSFYALAKDEAVRLWGGAWRQRDVLYVLMDWRQP